MGNICTGSLKCDYKETLDAARLCGRWVISINTADGELALKRLGRTVYEAACAVYMGFEAHNHDCNKITDACIFIAGG